MKEILSRFVVLASAVALLVGCSNERYHSSYVDTRMVTLVAGIGGNMTKAAIDRDGNGAQVNHWVLEVYDGEGIPMPECRIDTMASGKERHAFKFSIRVDSIHIDSLPVYTVLIWADTKGMYNTDDLTSVTMANSVANTDALDAFSAKISFVVGLNDTISATLTRPLAQLNVITTDLDELWTTISDSVEYGKFMPHSFRAGLEVPTQYNVMTETASRTSYVNFKADSVYRAYKNDSSTFETFETNNNYLRHQNLSTLFMGYVFADAEMAVVETDLSFKVRTDSFFHKVSSVPIQRNHRTMIYGDLLSHDAYWNVSISNEWNEPESIVNQ